MKKCTKCNAEFNLSENLQGYSPVTIYQLEYCPKCLTQVVNVEAALKIMEFNKEVQNEKKIREQKTLWEKIKAFYKKEKKSN